MADILKVEEHTTLLKHLNEGLQGWARNKIKKRLQTGCVVVNGKSVTQHNYALRPGDHLEIMAAPPKKPRGPAQLDIIFQDKDLVAINKPAGLLSVASNVEKQYHALSILRDQLSTPRNPVKLWPVHRLDRDTSGVLLFATSKEQREEVAAVWSDAEKVYLAVVEGNLDPINGTIDVPLRMDPNTYDVVAGQHPEAKWAITHYETVKAMKGRSLLEVKLDTGRQHQIRVHMAHIGHPVIGDERYGKKGKHMGLHATRLTFRHPKLKKNITIHALAPDEFDDLTHKRVGINPKKI